jgi:hypothetical protein
MLRVIFWVVPRRVDIHSPMKMKQTQCSETSAIHHQTPGNNPKDYTQGKAIPVQASRPCGFQEVEAPRFQNSRVLKGVMLSALRTGRI